MTILDKKKWLQSGMIIQIPGQIPGQTPNTSRYILGTPSNKKTSISSYTPHFFDSNPSLQNIEVIEEANLSYFLENAYTEWNFSKWKEPSYPDFKNQFQDFQNLAQKNTLKKAVPVFFFSHPIGSFNEKHRSFLLKNLLEKKEGWVYGMWNSKEGILGCTPEYLFFKKDQMLSTMALAGTAQDSNHCLMTDEKEVSEHQFVVQGISQQWRTSKIQKSKMYEWNFSTLKHLRTDFLIQIQKEISFLRMVQKMHPTPALGGFPEKKAYDWLLQYEKKSPIERKRHGSPFGIQFNQTDGFCLVAIRNIQWDTHQIVLGSGCGWIQNSKIDKEWLEIQNKKRNVLDLLT